jgi:uncharacterized membrane protein
MDNQNKNMLWLYQHLHWVWLVLIAPIAIVMVFLTPAFQVPDEFSHFAKVDQVSRGFCMPQMQGTSDVGNQTSIGVKKLIEITGYQSIPFHEKVKVDVITTNNVRPSNIVWEPDTAFYRNNNTAVYFPTGYVVQAVGLLAAKSMKMNVISSFYFSRYFSCMICVLLTFLAIRMADHGKLLIFIILSLPMTLFEYASLSQDGILISATAIGISLISGTRDSPVAVNRIFLKQMLGLAMVTLLVLGKPPYIFILFYFMVDVYLKNRDFRVVVIGFGAMVLTAIVLWTLAVAPYVKIPLHSEANPALQVAFLKTNPNVLVSVVLANALENVNGLSKGMVGILGWLDTWLSNWSYLLMQVLIYTLVIVGLLISFYKKKYHSLLVILIAIVTMFMLSLSMYIAWTPVGLARVEGCQGRYMIPVFLFIAIASNELWISRPKALSNLLVMLMVISSLIVGINAVFAILQRYYM